MPGKVNTLSEFVLFLFCYMWLLTNDEQANLNS